MGGKQHFSSHISILALAISKLKPEKMKHLLVFHLLSELTKLIQFWICEKVIPLKNQINGCEEQLKLFVSVCNATDTPKGSIFGFLRCDTKTVEKMLESKAGRRQPRRSSERKAKVDFGYGLSQI